MRELATLSMSKEARRLGRPLHPEWCARSCDHVNDSGSVGVSWWVRGSDLRHFQQGRPTIRRRTWGSYVDVCATSQYVAGVLSHG
jgi:hypothetical protein